MKLWSVEFAMAKGWLEVEEGRGGKTQIDFLGIFELSKNSNFFYYRLFRLIDNFW